MAPPIASFEEFCIHHAVMDGAAQEPQFGYADIGPTDSLLLEDHLAASETFFGSLLFSDTPTSTPPSTRSSLPSPPAVHVPPPNRGSQPSASMTLQPSSGSSHPLAGNSATRKRKKQSKARKRDRRREENAKKPRYRQSEDVKLKCVTSASSIATPYNASKAPITSTGFIALPDKGRAVHSLDYLVGKLGFHYVEATEG